MAEELNVDEQGSEEFKNIWEERHENNQRVNFGFMNLDEANDRINRESL